MSASRAYAVLRGSKSGSMTITALVAPDTLLRRLGILCTNLGGRLISAGVPKSSVRWVLSGPLGVEPGAPNTGTQSISKRS